MVYKTITYEVKEGKIAVLTLNRPSDFNAINQEMALELVSVLQEAERDEGVRVLIITGAGKAFCAGGDLAWLMRAVDNLEKRDIVDNAAALITELDRFTKPIIAAVNGVAAGAGTALVLGSDIIIASDKAKFTPNFVNIAAVPDSGASWYLPRKIGYHKAIELMLTGRAVEAGEAYKLNIFNQVVPEDNLWEEVYSLATRLANGPQRAVKYIKKMLKLSSKNDLAAQMETEASLQLMAWSDDDFKEGVDAFLAKRNPQFQ
ncbi:MAG: enoyl-CoA hydratase/isomerase family protein [Firmicutes bacterium]|nr:enoyl-CoA hydratase/isomerase family protein [Bacillota bacterium]